MLRRPNVIFLLSAAMAILEGCLPSETMPTPTRILLEPPPTFTPTCPTWPAPTIIPSPVQAVTATTLALPPEDILKYQPLEVASDLPPVVKPNGALVFYGEPPYLLFFEPQVRVETLPDIDSGCCLPFPTSPDGKWLAYYALSADSPTEEWLIVESADQQQQYKVPMDIPIYYSLFYTWLDNQHLIFSVIGDEFKPKPVVIINPFTGEQVELASDYPGLQLSLAGPAGRMNFNVSDVAYDPSLNLVVYPELGSPNHIVLWDRRSRTALAKVEELGPFGHYPLWSPDAKQFVVAVTYQSGQQYGNFIQEWFSVSREGKVERLTHFGDYFAHARIGVGNWSPDGNKLAFWLETDPALCTGWRLAVLADTLTHFYFGLMEKGRVAG